VSVAHTDKLTISTLVGERPGRGRRDGASQARRARRPRERQPAGTDGDEVLIGGAGDDILVDGETSVQDN
jgi:hypothetical protein